MTVTISNDAPETFAAGGCTFRVLDDGTSTGGRLGVVALELVPGWGGPPQHVHREHDETFFVVQGTVRFTSGTETLLATAGQLVTAPIGDPHTFANADEQAPASLLCSVTPERYLGYFRDLAELAAGATGPLDPTQVLKVMARYATDPYKG